MMQVDVLVTILSGAVLAGGSIALMYLMVRLRRVLEAEQEASEIVKNILTELRSRLEQQDRKIVDQQVRLEVLELKLLGNRMDSVKRSEDEKPAAEPSRGDTSWRNSLRVCEGLNITWGIWNSILITLRYQPIIRLRGSPTGNLSLGSRMAILDGSTCLGCARGRSTLGRRSLNPLVRL